MTPVSDLPPDPSVARSDAVLRRVGIYLAAVFLGGMLGLAGMFAAVRLLGPGSLPVVSAQELAEARAIWKQAAVLDYDLEVVVTGMDRSTFSLQVRGGEVRDAQRNGQRLKQQRVWGVWSVPGMFETIQRDLATAARIDAGESPSGAVSLSLRGIFDSRWGFPQRYQRTEGHRSGADREVWWEVTRFQPL